MPKKRITLEEFLQRSKDIHGDKYNYSKVDQKDFDHKVTIVCPIHGEFKQTIHNHMAGTGCPECWSEKRFGLCAKSTEKFIEDAKKVHGDKYDYSKTVYTNSRSKVTIVCPEHGEFEQSPIVHINGHGCPKCANELNGNLHRKSLANLIMDFRKVHGNKYDYSKVVYKNVHEKVEIICPEHGSFFQKPNTHLNGCGCQQCNESVGERKTRLMLEKHQINNTPQMRFNDLKTHSYDFWIPSLNILIEYQGDIHFKSVDHFGGDLGFQKRLENDIKKYRWAELNEIPVLCSI